MLIVKMIIFFVLFGKFWRERILFGFYWIMEFLLISVILMGEFCWLMLYIVVVWML